MRRGSLWRRSQYLHELVLVEVDSENEHLQERLVQLNDGQEGGGRCGMREYVPSCRILRVKITSWPGA